jgi:hypothetical protein
MNFLMRFEGKKLSMAGEWFMKKRKMHEKYLKEPLRWFHEKIKRELNLSKIKGNEGTEELNDRVTSSSASPSASFSWPHLVHIPDRHTTTTTTGQAKAQIWPLMSSPQ